MNVRLSLLVVALQALGLWATGISGCMGLNSSLVPVRGRDEQQANRRYIFVTGT